MHNGSGACSRRTNRLRSAELNAGFWRGWHAGPGDGWGGRGVSSGQGGPDYRGCWQGTRGAHVEHAGHARDAGRVEAQRLGGIGGGAACGPGCGRAGGGSGASCALGGPNYRGCWQGTRGAHREHGRHAFDAGGIEAQRLVERRRALPSRKGSIGRGVTCGSAKGRGGVAAAQGARWEGPTIEFAGRARAERTPNMNDMSVTLEVSRLSGWLNADAPCRVEREA
eukprot:scaffold34965_cov68-Phaeocystis_antarctica.AAC.4